MVHVEVDGRGNLYVAVKLNVRVKVQVQVKVKVWDRTYRPRIDHPPAGGEPGTRSSIACQGLIGQTKRVDESVILGIPAGIFGTRP